MESRPAKGPDEERLAYRELSVALAAAPRVYHFGNRCGDVCAVPCGTGRWLCDRAAREEIARVWTSGPRDRHLMIALFSARAIVGVFTDYWMVQPDGSAVHYYVTATDRSGSNCGDWCGLHREYVSHFLDNDGRIVATAPGSAQYSLRALWERDS